MEEINKAADGAQPNRDKTAPKGAESVVDIGMLDPAGLEFFRNKNGFLAMKKDGEEFKRVKLSRALPFSEPGRYVAVSDMEGKEIGILRDLSALAPEQGALLEEELDSRYFCPGLTGIFSIKEKMGYYYFEVDISGFKKTFAVKDISRNIKQLDEKAIIVTDADGNRYFIADIWKIDAKSRRKLEPYMY